MGVDFRMNNDIEIRLIKRKRNYFFAVYEFCEPTGSLSHYLYNNQFDGEFGGLWRSNGRPPQSLVGVGFVAEGFDSCHWYERTADSRNARAAFIFEGVTGNERIGDFGVLGGAAGLELDAADVTLGTPHHALVLARSTGHSNVYLVTVEEMLSTHPAVDGLDNPLVRAELVFFETASGGAVFSTGSIAWAASLCHNGYDNNVATVTRNVLRRFAELPPRRSVLDA